MPQQAKAEEIDGFVRQFETGGTGRHVVCALRIFVKGRRGRVLSLDPSFFHETADDLVDELVELLRIALAAIVQPLLQQALGNLPHLHEFFDDRLPQRFEVVRITDIAKTVLEAALKKELRHLIEEFLQAEAVEQ